MELTPAAVRDSKQRSGLVQSQLSTRIGPAVIFADLIILSLLFWWRPVLATLRLAASNEAYTHILLILPLSLALVYLASQQKRDARKAVSGPEVKTEHYSLRLVGAVALAFATLTGAAATRGLVSIPTDVRISLAIFALVMFWIASVIFSFGGSTFRKLLFPLCFLFFLVPLPGLLLDPIVRWLQHGSALVAMALFHSAGEHAWRDGVLLHLRGLTIEVAPECSSIRSSCLLLISTLFLGHLFLRSWWRILVLLLIAFPLSVVKNGLRIFAVAELGLHVDPAYLDGSFHHHGGVIFLLLALAVIIVLLAILQRDESRTKMLRLPSTAGEAF